MTIYLYKKLGWGFKPHPSFSDCIEIHVPDLVNQRFYESEKSVQKNKTLDGWYIVSNIPDNIKALFYSHWAHASSPLLKGESILTLCHFVNGVIHRKNNEPAVVFYNEKSKNYRGFAWMNEGKLHNLFIPAFLPISLPDAYDSRPNELTIMYEHCYINDRYMESSDFFIDPNLVAERTVIMMKNKLESILKL